MPKPCSGVVPNGCAFASNSGEAGSSGRTWSTNSVGRDDGVPLASADIGQGRGVRKDCLRLGGGVDLDLGRIGAGAGHQRGGIVRRPLGEYQPVVEATQYAQLGTAGPRG